MNGIKTGIVGETVHANLMTMRNRLLSADPGGAVTTVSFSDMLRAKLPDVRSAAEKTAAEQTDARNKNVVPDGKTLIYAITNAKSDTTASAVLRKLGIVTGNESGTSEADQLMSSLNLLNTVKNGDDAAIMTQLSDFSERFNSMLDWLKAQGTSSSYMYEKLLSTAAVTAKDALSSAGIGVAEDGRLSFDANKYETLDADGFLAGVSAAVSSVSTYASTVRNSSGLLGLLTGGEDNDSSSTADLMTSLMDLYM